MILDLDPRLLPIALAACFIVWAAVSDIKKFRIPNITVVGCLLCGVMYAFLTAEFKWLSHITAFVVLFAICFLLFHFRIMGGGDAKLISAMGFWTGFADLLPFLLMMAVAGAVFAVAIAVIKALRGRSKAGENKNAEAWRTHAMPYGVAIAVAALVFYAELAYTVLNPAIAGV